MKKTNNIAIAPKNYLFIKNLFTVNGVTYAKIPKLYSKGKIANPKTKKTMNDADSIYVRLGEDGKWYLTRMDLDADNINYYFNNKPLIDLSNEIIDNQWEQGDGHKIAVNLADARTRQLWFSNEDATKFLLTTAGLGMLGAGAVTAPLATALGLAGGYAGGKAVDAGMQKATGKTWGQWINDKTGLPEWFTEFTNPGMLVGGGFGAKMVKPALATYNNYRLAKAINDAVKNNVINQIAPKNSNFVRTKVGDLIIEPQSSYRQGSYEQGLDFLNTGKVIAKSSRGKDINASVPGTKLRLSKSFTNPMFAQGKLWYGDPINKPSTLTQSVLVTREPLGIAGKSSKLFNVDINGTSDVINARYGNSGVRRVPLNENQLNLNNTTLYNYVPGYGYKKVNLNSLKKH